MSASSFGQELKYWRKVRDLTQTALAEQIGYSLSALRKLESGALRPSHNLVHRLADVLHLSGDDRARFLTLADFIGLDTCLAIMEVLRQRLGDDKYRPCPLLRKMVAAGLLGKKSGRGFYQYG